MISIPLLGLFLIDDYLKGKKGGLRPSLRIIIQCLLAIYMIYTTDVYILSLVTNLLPENGDYLKIVLDYNNIYDVNGNLIDESKSINIIPFNQQILSDQQLLSVASQGGRIKKKKIIGNSSKGKYGNSNVNSNASVGSY